MGDSRTTTGVFHRKSLDKRLVREVVSLQRAPKYWMPMAIAEQECKLMEVRKFSSEYFNLDAKFRRPGLELISGYAVQNPFLWGQYLLRREQMKMQLVGSGQTVKEKDFFSKTEFDTFERILRLNFDPRLEGNPQTGVTFFTDSLAADASKPDSDNIRLMVMTKVLIGTCIKRTIEEGESSLSSPSSTPSIHPITALPVDTVTDFTQTKFDKVSMNEVYPEFILIYRMKTGMKDTRSTRLKVKSIQISYRSGTRFNPQDQLTVPSEVDDVDKIETAGVFAETSLANISEKDVKLVDPRPTVTSEPKKGRTGFKKSLFGLRFLSGEKGEEEIIEDETQEKLMEE